MPFLPTQVREGPSTSTYVERGRLPASAASETGQCSLTIERLTVGQQYAFQVSTFMFHGLKRGSSKLFR
jgi:hypothetical protein